MNERSSSPIFFDIVTFNDEKITEKAPETISCGINCLGVITHLIGHFRYLSEVGILEETPSFDHFGGKLKSDINTITCVFSNIGLLHDAVIKSLLKTKEQLLFPRGSNSLILNCIYRKIFFLKEGKKRHNCIVLTILDDETSDLSTSSSDHKNEHFNRILKSIHTERFEAHQMAKLDFLRQHSEIENDLKLLKEFESSTRKHEIQRQYQTSDFLKALIHNFEKIPFKLLINQHVANETEIIFTCRAMHIQSMNFWNDLEKSARVLQNSKNVVLKYSIDNASTFESRVIIKLQHVHGITPESTLSCGSKNPLTN